MSALAIGCGPSVPAIDAGSDAGPRIDAGPGADAGPDGGVDGGSTMDGGARTCLSPEGADPSGTDAWEDALGRATVTVDGRASCRRSYTLTTTATLRDAQPANPRTVVEAEAMPTLRSGHDLFDALHALALEEAGELSVSTIRDGAFSGGSAIDCGGCFETGRLWTYVWTRDTAYSVDLGLSAIDPTRARHSLEFKLSERRGGGDEQIVQDTGSGGSYPVSSDRVAWALGAWAVLHQLTGAERDAFRARALNAISNTLEHDRRIVYDATDGLYFGEQSFLDWREQSYPEWTAGDVVHIAMSKALSTNLLHLRALEIASSLAEESGDTAQATRYAGWASELRAAIRTRFWLEDDGLFSTFATTFLDPAPVRRYDLLGSALAVIFGVATESQSARVLASYPRYGPGAPVIFPEQQLTAIYHNRAEWPFVSAYWLRAAKRAENDAVADRMVRALIRGAALNLSNMENFEASTGAAYVEDGAYSGPVVNSQRQLWSVAGFLSMVHHTIFGLEPEADGLHVRPFLTRGLRSSLFGGTDTIVLNDYSWRGRRVTVVLHLPASASGGGTYAASEMRLNGSVLAGDLLPDAMLEETNRVDVVLADAGSAATLTERSAADWRQIFGPRTPRITGLSEVGGRIALALDRGAELASDVTFSIYRDGGRVATDLPGTSTQWIDPDSDPGASSSPCYALELTFAASGNRSQHSPPVCFWGRANAHVTTINAADMASVGGVLSDMHGRTHYEPWGDPGDSLTASGFVAPRTGPYLLQLTFGNGAGSINTGITCGIKRIVVEDEATGAIVAQGPVVMPHLGAWSRWEDSSFVRASLTSGRSYRFVIRGDEDVVNMSSFAHFERYTGGNGGTGGAYNRVNIASLQIFAR